MTQAEQFAEENGMTVEVNQAYIDNVGEDYATAEQVEEAYVGEYESDEEFAMDYAEQVGALEEAPDKWPFTCIDWEKASRDLMYDHFEVEGYYFRNL